MRSTLFYVPHEIAGFPLFGVGLLLGCLVLACLAWIAWRLATKTPIAELLSALPVWCVAAAIIAFVLPSIEQVTGTGEPIGLPIRGYGVMVLLGFLSGIAISVYRGRQIGLPDDTVIGLGFLMMLGGVLGARIFYVVQKWQEFEGEGLAKLAEAFKLTEGGLVIYGGVIGGLVAGAFYCYRHRLYVPAVADLVAPGFLLGLSFGRVGCLLHGCCFGGICTADLPRIPFPQGSGPYQMQLLDGSVLGIEFAQTRHPPGRVDHVATDSAAAQAGVKAGDWVDGILLSEMEPTPERDPALPPPLMTQIELPGKHLRIASEATPDWSLPLHPTQIYASLNALLLCLLIWHLQPLPSRDGVAFCIAILLYALSRFLLEWVRSDEAGQLGTSLTISQWVSLATACLATVGLILLFRSPRKRVFVWR
ncbi:prolipoprotein diacylglyceryl transferase family protein [Aureliella helgolandensis]|uniref:Phosphatidylglycerol--prolipoprotein diacylglyceryl transferase n=1 Tax=Aureliella helgolandensis TaxID=2527968 RepID=A0A518G505_9BACT|nr:prolipoprotein diacylglyceryl transferase family protein [Aureliella helgolandensis]QDV23673.1 Prolipoprotein diacylglyceryl transferase [Aureliella helgolandensis]